MTDPVAEVVSLYERLSQEGTFANSPLRQQLEKLSPQDAQRLYRTCMDDPLHHRTMTLLGILHYWGIGVEKDAKKSIEWLTGSASLGNADAIYRLGYCHSTGTGVPQDHEVARRLYRHSAELGHSEAMRNLGVTYLLGEGIPVDLDKAIEWFTQSAHRGNRDAMNNLGLRLSDRGDHVGAVAWFEKGVSLGCPDTMHNLGLRYLQGQGVEKDLNKAIELFQRSADLGNPKAMNCLGFRYKKGEGVERDPAQALAWFRKSASAGNEAGMYNVANRIVEDDPIEALWLYTRALDLFKDETNKENCADVIEDLLARKSVSLPVLREWIRLRDENAVLRAQVNGLKTEVDDLKTEVSFRPGGDGYSSARDHFESLVAGPRRQTVPRSGSAES